MRPLLTLLCSFAFLFGCSKSDTPPPPPDPGNGGGNPGPQQSGNNPPLAIVQISPDSAESGPITITGTGFSTTPVHNTVRFGNDTAVVTAATATQLVVNLPDGLLQGKHDVSVTTDNKTVTKAKGFHQVGWAIRIVAGTGVAGDSDGPVATATFRAPAGMTMDSEGNLYVTDQHKIRKISPQGIVTTIAGSNARGSTNGNGTAARFNFVTSIVMDRQQNLYVTDQMNFLIPKIAPNGDVSTIAGTDGTPGKTDGIGTNASFSMPYGLAINADSTALYVGDQANNLIRKIELSTYEVTTVAGNGQPVSIDGKGLQAGIPGPGSMIFDKDGILYITEKGGGKVRKMMPDGTVTTIGGYLSVNASPTHIAVDEHKNVYVTFSGLGKIKKFTPAGQESEMAGNNTGVGEQEGPATTVVLQRPEGIVLVKDGAGNNAFYVSDATAHTIKKIIKG
jgi:sugar lactone lactonase YvrE